MKRLNLTRKQKRMMIGGGVLAAALLLCAWLFGWGRGSIHVIDFSADEVDHVRLSCDQL